MRNPQSRLATAFLIALGMLVGAASIAADQTPEEILKSRGLKRAGTVFVLPADTEFVPKVAKLRPSYQELYAAYRKLAPIMQLHAEYEMLDDDWTVVNEQLRNVQAEIDAHPPLSNNELRQNWQNLLEAERQLKLQYNYLRTQVNLRYKRLTPDAEKEKLQDEFLKLRNDFLESSRQLREQVDKIKGDYATLYKDKDVKNALEKLKLSMKGGASLGPSPDFRKESAWLINAVKSTSPDSFKSKNAKKNAKTAARSKNTSKDKATMPDKEPPLKTAKKGGQDAESEPDDPKASPK